MTQPMIQLQNVSKTYTLKGDRQVRAVDEVSMDVQEGEFVVITGRSGSGKTTLLNLVAGLARPSSGKVLLDDIEVWRLPDKEQSMLRNQRLGFVFQFPSLMPSLTSLENVMLPRMFSSESPASSPQSPDGTSEAQGAVEERAAQLLTDVGLSDKLDSFPRQLSGGQQQRVVIARSLMNQPDLLLADEPTSDLDEQTEREIMAIFREIHSRTGITILLVTHASELEVFGTRGMRMAGGRIVPRG